jgi:chromosome partitioning protein
LETITLVTQKGGSGKSTLAINLAVAARTAKRRVLLIDLDPQRTAAKWYQRREVDEPAVVTIAAPQLADALHRAQAAQIDLVIIDTAGRDDPSSTAAMKHADFCLVACRPTPADMEALSPTIEALHRLKKPFAFVMAQTPANGFRIREAEIGLGHQGTVAPVPIVYRVAYQDALGNGQGVTEFDREGKAAREIIALWHWIYRAIRKCDGR